MNDKLSLCLKITNWCNLKCAHCCELSDPKEPKQFMPLDKFETYIHQFGEIDIPKTEYYTIGGGEPTAPYAYSEPDYIPRAVSMILDAGAVPTIKTNATWGKHTDERQTILKSLAAVAYKYQKLVTLDISLDEFHKNTIDTANVISDIVKSDMLRPAIRVFLAGFNTQASLKRLNELQDELKRRNLHIISSTDIDGVTEKTKYDFGALYRGMGNMIFASFETPIFRDGRAAITNVATTGPSTGMTSIDGNCLVVDNNDNAILNYKFREQIAGRDLNTVVQSLMAKMYQAQGR